MAAVIRPDADSLLAQLQEQERRAARGKLRIYFGASAGVGKTYAMLSAAHKLRAGGKEVLVGVVESHGRAETAALIGGLDLLPPKVIDYRDKTLTEFDLDAALARKPPLILMDELAHTNATGSRHPKRWQDVDELLAAGIDVYTTVNVQHLESLNDVVGGITGIRVAETLPDTIFDNADEVVLVDVPADELLARLKGGKVYPGAQAERAAKNFFRKGNLIALRELALRRTADRLEDDVQAYRIEQSISAVWKTDSALLACIGPRSGAEQIIRSTARLAGQLNADWHVIYIETPTLQRLPPSQRERILKTLKLGEELGATTAVLSGNDIANEIVGYARGKNFSKIILGRGHPTWPWRTPHIQRIAQLAPDIDLTQLGRETKQAGPIQERPAPSDSTRPSFDSGATTWTNNAWLQHIGALGASLTTALIATPLLPFLDLANIVMLFLLTVVLIAVRFGRGPAVTATVVSVLAFDFFFVPPRFSFAVNDFQYIITFGVMLAVGLITAHLTADLRFQARIAAHREGRARALYEFARELSSVLQTEQIFEITRTFIARTFRAKATLLVPDAYDRLQGEASRARDVTSQTMALPLSPAGQSGAIDLGIAQWAFDRATPAGIGTDTLPGSHLFYLPLVAPMRTRGVLAIEPEDRRLVLIPEQRQQLDTFAVLAAIALERVHYIEVAQDALVRMESERLRNSLLAALSHDLRTPLTSLVGLSDALARSIPLTMQQKEFAELLHRETLRMSSLVANLLDMARIQSGEIKFNLEWQPVEEVIGSALRASASFLGRHPVETHVPNDLPLIELDAVLIERVLCNLLENAAKYTPTETLIVITARLQPAFMEISVVDNGPGLPVGKEQQIFEKFVRGEKESSTPGVGLGLAICRAIVEAHGGSIHSRPTEGGGATLYFLLPLGQPPEMPAVEVGLPGEEGLS